MLRSTQISLILIKCLIQELKTHAETIVAFMTENGRPCDDLVEMKYTLLAHAENAQQNPSATAAPVAATAVPAAPVASGGARPCQIRLRLSDGSQVCDCGKMRVRNFAPLFGSVGVKVCLCCIPHTVAHESSLPPMPRWFGLKYRSRRARSVAIYGFSFLFSRTLAQENPGTVLLRKAHKCNFKFRLPLTMRLKCCR